VRLTVLGTGTIALVRDRSCSSYYMEVGEARILMDCGSGTSRRLAELGIDWPSITHVAITHFHIDHHGDLPTIIFAWKYGILPTRSAPLTIIGPVGTRALLDRVAAAYGDWVIAPGFPIQITELEPGAAFAIGDATLTCAKVPHTPESVAYSIQRGDHRIVYSGDTGFDAAFAEWARGCDLLLLECSLPETMAIPEHLTPEQCGEIGRLAAPGQLVLTHLYPPVESVDVLGIVRTRYDGNVTIARDGWRTVIGD
jgi:ribonuclease BN (tRNA processing enzyme)